MLAAGRRLIEHPRVGELYPAYLRASHWIIRASVPLMETALDRARELAGDDPAARAWPSTSRTTSRRSAATTTGCWRTRATRAGAGGGTAEPPLGRRGGARRRALLLDAPLPPVAVLGYIALLEGYPPTIADVDALMARTGYPHRRFRTIRHAGSTLHRDDLDEALDGLPLSPAHSAVVGLCALHSVEAFTRVIDELVDSF